MTDVEVRLKCLDLAIKAYGAEHEITLWVGEGEEHEPLVLKDADVIYDWVTKNTRHAACALQDRINEVERALTSFNEV